MNLPDLTHVAIVLASVMQDVCESENRTNVVRTDAEERNSVVVKHEILLNHTIKTN